MKNKFLLLLSLSLLSTQAIELSISHSNEVVDRLASIIRSQNLHISNNQIAQDITTTKNNLSAMCNPDTQTIDQDVFFIVLESTLEKYHIKQILKQILQKVNKAFFEYLLKCPLIRKIGDRLLAKNVTIYENHKDISSVAMVGQKIISGYKNGEIHIWDPRSTEKQILKGHTGPVTSLVVVTGSKLVSSSQDNTIRIWKLDSGQCKKVLNNQAPVNSIIVTHKHKIVSRSRDNAVKVWDLHSGICENIFPHDGYVSSITALGNNIYTVSRCPDSTYILTIWDPNKFADQNKLVNIYVSKFLNSDGYLLTASANKIISGSTTGTLSILNLSNPYSCSLTGLLKPDHGFANTFVNSIDNNKVVSGSADGFIRIWNLHSKTCEHTFIGHLAPIATPVNIVDKKIIFGTSKGTVNVCNLGVLDDLEKAIRCLPSNDQDILSRIQSEIIKDDLCDKDGLSPLEKAKKFGASQTLHELLEVINFDKEETPHMTSIINLMNGSSSRNS